MIGIHSISGEETGFGMHPGRLFGNFTPMVLYTIKVQHYLGREHGQVLDNRSGRCRLYRPAT